MQSAWLYDPPSWPRLAHGRPIVMSHAPWRVGISSSNPIAACSDQPRTIAVVSR
jgi:hypothetical protein